MDIIAKYLPPILVGLAVLIPMMIALIKYVNKAAEDKNWNVIVKMVLDLMVQAEQDYSTGAERKEFVMNQLKVMAKTVDFEIDWDKVSDLIDALCDMAHEVNVEG
jgi:hypothetical protein